MDLGTASALSLFNFQTASAASGQPAALLQAMTRLYDQATVSTGANALDDLVLRAGLAPLAEAVENLAGAGTVPVESLQSYLTYGGLNSATAASLFATDASTGYVGLNGFDTAITAQATLALAAYQATLNGQTPTESPFAASLNLLG